MLRLLNYGNYGIFLIMGNAGFISSTVAIVVEIVIVMAIVIAIVKVIVIVIVRIGVMVMVIVIVIAIVKVTVTCCKLNFRKKMLVFHGTSVELTHRHVYAMELAVHIYYGTRRSRSTTI